MQELFDLQLWFVYPDDLAQENLAKACADLLSEEERQRAQRFRNEVGRRESLTSRALARVALSHVHPLPPREWRFATNAHGKPYPDPDCGLRFNLSNSSALVACLVARGVEVGVDVEPEQRAEQILRVAGEVFSPVEQAQLSALSGGAQLDRALSLWTLKEAYIKARGLGLSLPLPAISFVFDHAAGFHMELDATLADDARRWKFCLLQHAGHRIAVMVEQSGAAQLTVLEARPLLSAPRAVHTTMLGWFPKN